MLLEFPLVLSQHSNPKKQLTWLKCSIRNSFSNVQSRGSGVRGFLSLVFVRVFQRVLLCQRVAAGKGSMIRGNGDKLNILRLKLRDSSLSRHRTRLYFSASVFCTHFKIRQKKKVCTLPFPSTFLNLH